MSASSTPNEWSRSRTVFAIIGVVQDSVETALNSSGDVFFTATAEEFDRKKKGDYLTS
jgi:Na+/serine symporter